MSTLSPVYRSFTKEQSSAIANIEVDYLAVEIIFQSNQDRAYGFNATSDFADYLIEVLESPDLKGISLGRLIAEARKSGDLEPIEG